MFAVGVCIGTEAKYERWAAPGIEAVREVDTQVFTLRDQRSLFAAYNTVLDEVAGQDALEGLLLIHEDVLMRGPDTFDRLRAAFSDPAVGIAGVYGARRPRSLDWHSEPGTFGFVEETRFVLDRSRATTDVDVLDGLLLALSPTAVRTLRFDEERFSGFHGYDADICLQARAAGLRVVTTELDVFHATKGTFGDRRVFLRTDLVLRGKWAGTPHVSPAMRRWDASPRLAPLALRAVPARAAVADWRASFGAWRRRGVSVP